MLELERRSWALRIISRSEPSGVCRISKVNIIKHKSGKFSTVKVTVQALGPTSIKCSSVNLLGK
jgi:hypothetical protein